MKKLSAAIALMAVTVIGHAQHVDNFTIGPYEVDYRGEGDVKFRLQKNIDLYEYFGLARDTVVTVAPAASVPVRKAFQAELVLMPRYGIGETSPVIGIEGTRKYPVGRSVFLNAGLAVGTFIGTYLHNERRDCMFEAGLPLSVEWSRPDRKKAGLYGSIGAVPTFYTMLYSRETLESGETNDLDKPTGLFIAPRLQIGGYLPVGPRLFRIGLVGQYNVPCTSSRADLFDGNRRRIFMGGTVGLVF